MDFRKSTSKASGFKRSNSKESLASQASVKTTSTVKSERFADKASGNLYDIFKQFDGGKIDADGFIRQVENTVGIPATPEFVSYIRTNKHTKCEYSKIAASLNYNKDQKANSSYHPPVNPYDLNHHRGKRNKVAGPGA